MTVRLLMIEIVLREAYLPLFGYRGRDFFDQSGEIKMPAKNALGVGEVSEMFAPFCRWLVGPPATGNSRSCESRPRTW